MSRIPSLDGLRAIAILVVCLAHVGYMKDSPVQHFAGMGNLGVRIFFVISGMLITRLLLEEYNRYGGISLKGFYVRRTLRIFPALWIYVAVIAGLSISGIIAVPRHDFFRALTYTVNYQNDRSWYLGHIWSLSVEEQFYLLWPLLFYFGGIRVAKRAALAALILAPFLRAVLLLTMTQAAGPNSEWFPTTCDSIATGCLLALMPASRRKQTMTRWITSRYLFLLPILVVLVNTLHHRYGNSLLLNTAGVTFMNLAIALMVERVVMYPKAAMGTFLNSRPVAWIGRVSYSLYLWQMPFLNHQDSSWITRLPVNLLAALAMAAASYYLIETPILTLRKRYAWGERQLLPEAEVVCV